MSEILRYDTVKTRKDHHCHECGVVVARGEYMLSATYADGGKLTQYRACMECEYLRQVVHQLDESLLDYLPLCDCIGDDPAFDPAAVAAFHKRCEQSREGATQ